MDKRLTDLQDLQWYLVKVEKEVTMVLQSLQWDRKHLLEGEDLVSCSINVNHKIPLAKKNAHEKKCVVISQGYSKEDAMLPEPIDNNSTTLVKFCKQDVQRIIAEASSTDPSFRKGMGHSDCQEPLTLDRLQTVYSCDERRALYDAVVASAPENGDLNDLSMLSAEERKRERVKSKQEILAELRDMKRRRTKYRVATKSKNYSDVLRDVIKTQMEICATDTEIKDELNTESKGNKNIYNRKEKPVHDGHANERNRDSARHKDKHHNNKRETYPSNSSKDAYRDKTKYYSNKNEHDYKRLSGHNKDSPSSQDFKRSKYDDDYTAGRSENKYERERYHVSSEEVKIKIEPGASGSRQNRKENDDGHHSRNYKYNSDAGRHNSYDDKQNHRDDRYKRHRENRDEYGDRGHKKEETHRRYYDQYENDDSHAPRKHKKHSKDKYRDK